MDPQEPGNAKGKTIEHRNKQPGGISNKVNDEIDDIYKREEQQCNSWDDAGQQHDRPEPKRQPFVRTAQVTGAALRASLSRAVVGMQPGTELH